MFTLRPTDAEQMGEGPQEHAPVGDSRGRVALLRERIHYQQLILRTGPEHDDIAIDGDAIELAVDADR
jgi:hypothetical protein